MLRFIFFLVVIYLALRLIFRLLRGVFFLFAGRAHHKRVRSSSSPSSGSRVEEADYEVLETHIPRERS